MIHKTGALLFTITLFLCTPTTHAMHQRKGALSSASATSSTILTTPSSSLSPYEGISLKELKMHKKRFEDTRDDIDAQIKHKKDVAWPAQNPCCNCLVGEPTQIASVGCAFLSFMPLVGLALHAPPLPQTPPLFCLDNQTCGIISGALETASIFYAGISHCIYNDKIEQFTKPERDAKVKIQKELSKVEEQITTLEATTEKESQALWQAHKEKKLAKLQKKD